MPISDDSAAPADVHVGVIATSLAGKSRSQLLAREAMRRLEAAGVTATLLDLREHPLPLAGSGAGWGDPAVARAKALLLPTTHLLFAVPIYNYDVNAAAKNLVEFMGKDVLSNKAVGFLCSAGGQGSYMSVLGFANSLMLDFRCWIVPRFVYVTEDLLNADGAVADPEIDRRLDGLLADLRRLRPG